MNSTGSIQKNGISRTIATVLGRAVQLCSIAGIFYAFSHVQELQSTLQSWQNGTSTTQQLYASILWVSLPGWLGLSLLVYIERNLRLASYSDQSLSSYPNEPWLAKPEWTTPTLSTSDPVSLLAFIYVLVSIGLVAVPLAGAYTRDQVVYMICTLMAMVTVSFLVGRYFNKDWRNSIIELETFPGVIGDSCCAVFSIHRTFPPETIFSASLQCTYLLPHSSSDETDNTRRIFWSKTIEVNHGNGSQAGVTLVPLRFSIPGNCPESTIVESGDMDSNRDVRWELVVQRKNAGYLGVARFDIPVFRTKNNKARSSPHFEQIGEQNLNDTSAPTYDAVKLLQQVNFREGSSSRDQLTITFRLRAPTLLKAGLLVGGFCVASILFIIFVVPNLIVQLFLGFLPSMILLAVLFNLAESWLWRIKIVRNGDQLVVNCGYPYLHPAIRCQANTEARLVCEVGFQSQTSAYESWNLVFQFKEERRLLLRQFGSQGEVETVQRWLADRLGIGIAENAGSSTISQSTSHAIPDKRIQSNQHKKSRKK